MRTGDGVRLRVWKGEMGRRRVNGWDGRVCGGDHEEEEDEPNVQHVADGGRREPHVLRCQVDVRESLWRHERRRPSLREPTVSLGQREKGSDYLLLITNKHLPSFPAHD